MSPEADVLSLIGAAKKSKRVESLLLAGEPVLAISHAIGTAPSTMTFDVADFDLLHSVKASDLAGFEAKINERLADNKHPP